MGKRINKAVCNRLKKQRERTLQRKSKQPCITEFFAHEHDANQTIEIQTEDDARTEFFQINNQKRLISCEYIAQACAGLNSFIVLGQEPSTNGFNITGLNRGHKIIQASVDKPRAYIYCHKSMNAWPVEELCTRDLAVCIINTFDPKITKLLVISIYWDGTHSNLPENLEKAIKEYE